MNKITKNKLVKPFVKWAGGKRQLMPEIIKYKPKSYKKFVEPFVGGGSVFMELQHNKTVINDLNSDLINTYIVIRDNVKELIFDLEKHKKNDSKEYFYELREWDRDGTLDKKSNVERASRFIYLNKTCFNGLFRVNSQGQFNVPYGNYKNPNIVNKEVLLADSKFLNKPGIKIMNEDFEKAAKTARKGDFVYFDPPYIPVNQTANFTNYTPNGFGLVQQKILRDTAIQLASKGVNVMLSNADLPLTAKLYSNPEFKIHHVQAKRSINSNGTKRGKVGEVIITTY